MSLRESLLDAINALKNRKVPSEDDAPKFRSLLGPVNEEAGESGWFDGAATPKTPPQGRIRVEAAKTKPLSGDVRGLPPLLETMGVEMPDGEEPKPAKAVDTYSFDEVIRDENARRGLLARNKPTKDDLRTLVSLAAYLKRQQEADPKAFEEQPEIAREFSKRFEALKGVTRDKLRGGEPTPEQLREADEKAARIAHSYANHKMTMSAAGRTAGEKGSNPERDQEFGMAGVDPEIFRERKWQSQDDLKKALAAAGPGAFVVGVRPLQGGFYRDPEAGSRADVENREVHHQHIFYLDADGNLRDAGYFDDGIRKGQEGRDQGKERQEGESDELDNLGRYRFGHIENGGDLRPETFDLKGFDASNYRLFTHNCQTYVEAAQKRMRQTQEGAPQE